jgi:exodeoxyribonuclease V alpha subunit
MRSALKEQVIAVRGRVEEIFFSSPRFSAGRLQRDDNATISFAGPIMVREHEPVILHGHWEKHPKYGRQFKVESLEYDTKLDREGLANYLANHPDIKGIGPVKARQIAARFGDDFDRVLSEQPEAIAEAVHLPLEAVHALRDEWLRTKAVNAALTWLAAFDLTHHQVKTLVERFGNNVVAILQTDPYLIAREVPGFAFKRVDKIARKMGAPKDHPSRIRAGLLHCVEERIDQGDCWVEYEELVDQANALLVMDTLDSRARIEQALDVLIEEKQLGCASYGGRFLVAKPALRAMEEELGELFRRGNEANCHLAREDDLEGLVEENAPDLNAGQRQAVLTALRHQITLVCGGAGSGKTYTVAAITRLCRTCDLQVVLCAPTGKAAKRLEQVVGQEAYTIHRLLGYDGREFRRTAADPIEADVVVIDEVSMVDVPLAWHLFQAIDLGRTAVVLVGDHNQLPPVGPGNILRDLIDTRIVPAVILDEIVRQAGVLKENSIAILQGEVRKTAPENGTDRRPWYLVDQFTDPSDVQRFLLDLFESVLVERLSFDLVEDVQVLTPTRKGPLGVEALNIELQCLVQKKLWGVEVPAPKPGRRPRLLLHDKVIQTRNNYDLGVMNGAVGRVTAVESGGAMEVAFNGQTVTITPESGHLSDLSLAYALTIHKAQGSEFPCAIVLVHKSHSFMHHRNLFYTGVTRAQQVAIVIGDRWGLRNCAQRRHLEARKTFLSLLGQYDGSGR